MSKNFLFIIGNNQDLEFHPKTILGETKFYLVNTEQMVIEKEIYDRIRNKLYNKFKSNIQFIDSGIKYMMFIIINNDNISQEKLEIYCQKIINNCPYKLYPNTKIYLKEINNLQVLDVHQVAQYNS